MQIKTTDGILEGETITSDICGTYYSFKGIPYAAPPIGDLRFKAPQPPQPWEGVRSAKNHGDICHQYNFITHLVEKGSEDCLYLNVYTPDINPAKPLPVMIWIHGGAYCCGSGNDDLYGPDYLIRHGVILVTFNYRLEALGFLCLDTEDIPGNAGVKDQVAAMRWVNKNIANFGGDPENVTIFGQSSGAGSVTYHCISPMTKGLFKRGIAQSGCLNNWMSQYYRPRERALALAKKLGCTSNDDKEIYEFFKHLPVDKLVHTQVPLTFAEICLGRFENQYSIVSEKEFPNVEPYLTGDIEEAVKNNVHEGVTLILGYNEDDQTIQLGLSDDVKKMVIDYEHCKQYFVPKDIGRYCSVHDQLDVGTAMKEFYLQKRPVSMRDMDPFLKFFGCEMYKYGIIQLAKQLSEKNKVYLYKFTCISERNFFSKIMGASEYIPDRPVVGHTDEIPYLFPVKSIKQTISKTSPTFTMIYNVSKLWTNFAKTGNPTPDISLGANWSNYRPQTQAYLNIGEKITRALKPDRKEMEFWEGIFMKYLPSKVYQMKE